MGDEHVERARLFSFALKGEMLERPAFLCPRKLDMMVFIAHLAEFSSQVIGLILMRFAHGLRFLNLSHANLIKTQTDAWLNRLEKSAE